MRLKPHVPFALLCSTLMACVGAPALAQDETPEVPEEPQRPASPLDGDGTYQAHWTNPAFAQIADMLSGSWKSNAALDEFGSDDSTDTVITFAPVRLEAYPNAMYVEVAAINSLHLPYFQAILQFWDRSGDIHLRTLEMIDHKRTDSMTAMWMYPAFFPALRAEELRGTLDMTMTLSGNGWSGSTSCAYPTNQRGAMEMTSEMRITPGSLQVADRFFDAAGALVSGPAAGSFFGFSKWDHPFTSEQISDSVWRITLLDLDAGSALSAGDKVGFHYWGYLRDSDNPGYMFDSSKKPGGKVLRLVAPGRLIPGLKGAIMGVQAGESHRFIVRSDVGYRDRAAAGGAIPIWSDLIFTFQTQYVTPPPPPAPTEPVGPVPDAEVGPEAPASDGSGGE